MIGCSPYPSYMFIANNLICPQLLNYFIDAVVQSILNLFYRFCALWFFSPFLNGEGHKSRTPYHLRYWLQGQKRDRDLGKVGISNPVRNIIICSLGYRGSETGQRLGKSRWPNSKNAGDLTCFSYHVPTAVGKVGREKVVR